MDKEEKERFAEAVKALRGSQSREEFAKALGVTRPTVIAWEAAKYTPKRESLETVATMRGESLDEFLSFIQGAKRKEPIEKIITQISAMPSDHLARILKAIAERMEKL